MARKYRPFLRNDLVAHLIVASQKNLLTRKPASRAFAGPGSEARIPSAIRLEEFAVAGSDQYRISRPNLNTFGFCRGFKIFGGYFLTRFERFDVLEARDVQQHASIDELVLRIYFNN